MYTITILNTDEVQITTVIAAGLFDYVVILRDSSRVAKFKVTNSTGTLMPHQFGWGDMDKWIKEFYPK